MKWCLKGENHRKSLRNVQACPELLSSCPQWEYLCNSRKRSDQVTIHRPYSDFSVVYALVCVCALVLFCVIVSRM